MKKFKSRSMMNFYVTLVIWLTSAVQCMLRGCLFTYICTMQYSESIQITTSFLFLTGSYLVKKIVLSELSMHTNMFTVSDCYLTITHCKHVRVHAKFGQYKTINNYILQTMYCIAIAIKRITFWPHFLEHDKSKNDN
jgi:hypothetical protein